MHNNKIHNHNNKDTLEITLTLNAKETSLTVDPADRLLDILRCQMKLTGTKEGCGEGECGACTVILNGLPVNSCLVPAYQANNCTLQTIESINENFLSNMLEQGTTQCGACSPGVVMTAKWLSQNQNLLSTTENQTESHNHNCEKNLKLCTDKMKQLLAGNLCRCTGYDGIIKGVTQTIITHNYQNNNYNNNHKVQKP